MPGRRPKPLALKRIHGSTEPHNPDEPVPEGDLTNECGCPAHFTAAQRDIWEYAVQNAPPGLLKRIDASALETWVVARALHRDATAAQAKRPLIGADGKASALIGVINRTAITMLRAACELGFTPTSRPRIFAAGPPSSKLTSKARAHDAPAQALEQYLADAPRASPVN